MMSQSLKKVSGWDLCEMIENLSRLKSYYVHNKYREGQLLLRNCTTNRTKIKNKKIK